MSDITVPVQPTFNQEGKQVGALIAAQERDLQHLQNFMFLIWTSNPNRDTVRLILNSGDIKLWMKRDKFMKVIKDLLGPKTHELEYTLYRFDQSMHVYGVWYFYDRKNDDFKEIGFQPDPEHLNPTELINESRKSIIKQKINDNFKEISKSHEEMTDSFITPPKNHFSQFFNVIRKFNKKK